MSLSFSGYARSPPTAAVMPFVRTDTDPRLLLTQGGVTAPAGSNVPVIPTAVQQASSVGSRPAGSPEGPVWFNVPGLQEETLLDVSTCVYYRIFFSDQWLGLFI